MYDNDDSDIYNEDDDSNDENYWANDYPDEDSDYEKGNSLNQMLHFSQLEISTKLLLY